MGQLAMMLNKNFDVKERFDIRFAADFFNEYEEAVHMAPERADLRQRLLQADGKP